MRRAVAASVTILLAASGPTFADEMAKRGGTLTYMLPADAPPSFDAHREATFATIHAVAPFYSVLIRADPENPSDTTHFVCDLCAAMPEPTDGGRTWTFTIRDNVKFSDGSTLTAVLPHREMFPTRQALPHQACSRCLTGLRPGHSSSSIFINQCLLMLALWSCGRRPCVVQAQRQIHRALCAALAIA